MRDPNVSFRGIKTFTIPLKGGINENVSSLELEPGELIDCKNYMIAEGGYGGYTSIPGFERFDGGLTPSTFESLVLTLENCALQINEGELITGTSGATGTALEDGQIISGSYLGGDAVVEVQTLIVSGDFQDTDECSTINGVVGDVSTVETLVGGTDDYNLGIQYARSNVAQVPGEGPILGLHIFNNQVYAWRKHSGSATIGFYVEDPSGWSEINTTSDPIAYIGDHEFQAVNYNFLATSVGYTMYWCDGQQEARSWDGTTYGTISNTGMGADDKPTNIAAHNNYLFLAYRGGSLQYSALGDPTNWTSPGEIGVGNDITNLVAGVQSSLIVYMVEGIRILQGATASTFTLATFSPRSGAFRRTAQRLLGTVFAIDDRGLATLEAVQEYGDYGANSISQRFKQTLLDRKHTVTATVVSRDLNQYRIFFDDRRGIIVSFEGREFQGATFIEYNKVVAVAAQGEDIEKRDLLVFASDEELGYVYKMDSGTSFDGSPITTRLTTAFFHYNSPRQWKAFKRSTLEIAGDNEQTFNFKVDFDYNEVGGPNTIWYSPEVYTVEGTAIYGESNWASMVYGAQAAATNRVPIYIQGVGTNMSYKVISNETYRNQHIVQNIITDFEILQRRI